MRWFSLCVFVFLLGCAPSQPVVQNLDDYPLVKEAEGDVFQARPSTAYDDIRLEICYYKFKREEERKARDKRTKEYLDMVRSGGGFVPVVMEENAEVDVLTGESPSPFSLIQVSGTIQKCEKCGSVMEWSDIEQIHICSNERCTP